MRSVLLFFTACVFLTACIFNACTTTGSATRGSRYLITAEEIASSPAQTAYEAIELLRPGLLTLDMTRNIAMSEAPPAMVLIDGTIISGGKEYLRTINAGEVAEIKYLPPSESTGRYGTRGKGGAFLVTLK